MLHVSTSDPLCNIIVYFPVDSTELFLNKSLTLDLIRPCFGLGLLFHPCCVRLLEQQGLLSCVSVVVVVVVMMMMAVGLAGCGGGCCGDMVAMEILLAACAVYLIDRCYCAFRDYV